MVNQIYEQLARSTLFRRRLRAFGKSTDGGASSKGRQNVESVELTVLENSSRRFETCASGQYSYQRVGCSASVACVMKSPARSGQENGAHIVAGGFSMKVVAPAK